MKPKINSLKKVVVRNKKIEKPLCWSRNRLCPYYNYGKSKYIWTTRAWKQLFVNSYRDR